MKWSKLGHVFSPAGTNDWKKSSALTPTPILLNEKVIRVYAGFRDAEGISRIGYVDVDAQDPTQVLKISDAPVLDRGRDGCFDDNGVILGDVLRCGNVLRMYYVGFQIVKRAKFLAFTGLAESSDGGETFHRVSEVPVMDRADGGTTIRAIHSVLFEDNVWKVWFAVGDSWTLINGQHYPDYNIWYTESVDGQVFNQDELLCIDVEGDEYRIGRPSVYKFEDKYYMFYTKGGTSGLDYFPGVAVSDDGKVWQRQDEQFGLELSEGGFDSTHLCYPRLVSAGNKTYCFYNGNNMGAEGFGVAELLAW
ncbi:hypothetical protein PspCFBP13508_04760 [Pseudomonas sp. CFBP13508]|jgi:hypothetical protein|uniref:Glycosyl hydrolase family 32 N-terminal domain-containing protein n=1 Tax=Pseudomonas mercuritolerans TaxID=2951809 RepID=A0ABT2XVI5_9PSED|nr:MULTISPECIES: hypothetical protein [Pseudomonas]MCV2222700.1 hypothetical protein [Pseudomonas mercuritolerans]TKJ73440.1 hypothetical protein PspCFBP13508_04760 [Pseudomonas sp. CFBP13508]